MNKESEIMVATSGPVIVHLRIFPMEILRNSTNLCTKSSIATLLQL